MFEIELQTYLKAASSALPCAEARAAFEGYVHCVAQDVCSATSEESFTVVVAQLGSTPEQAARDFMESQSPETIARWKAAAHRHKFRLRLALGLVIGVLVVLVTFFVVTKQRWTRGYKRYKETSGLIEWKECQIFHSIFT